MNTMHNITLIECSLSDILNHTLFTRKDSTFHDMLADAFHTDKDWNYPHNIQALVAGMQIQIYTWNETWNGDIGPDRYLRVSVWHCPKHNIRPKEIWDSLQATFEACIQKAINQAYYAKNRNPFMQVIWNDTNDSGTICILSCRKKIIIYSGTGCLEPALAQMRHVRITGRTIDRQLRMQGTTIPCHKTVLTPEILIRKENSHANDISHE